MSDYTSVESVLSKSVQNRRVIDFDDDDLRLLRSAYDTSGYHQDAVGYDPEPDDGTDRIDLIKDGIWALKAKLKELKAFDKALKAKLLLDKLKFEEFLKNHLSELKKHHHLHHDYEYEKPAYQVPPSHQYAPPQYAPQHYERPQLPTSQQYATPQYDRPPPHDPYYGQ
ncbi:hypothetical protein EVAR_41447_1 [Eumeta japonica]|uniref:Uncharacterized protein n=1 Tax=Eumeta variegata TaxID=151549 RepID=A0A4C1W7E2_EUMVA|nr:hypothetical protein EVAR_41447_1 [Eumeta japonica]